MQDGVWLAAMEGQPTQRSYRHVAFKIDVTELPLFQTRLRALGIEVEPPRPKVEVEGRAVLLRLRQQFIRTAYRHARTTA
jgi:hypothetical protein